MKKAEFPFQRHLQDYLRSVTAIDENVGRLLDYLDEKGLAENTIVIYSSDQGFLLRENGWMDKRTADEVTMKMPFVIRWKEQIPPGQRPTEMIQNIDYGPTFLYAARIEVPKDIHVGAILPILKSETPA